MGQSVSVPAAVLAAGGIGRRAGSSVPKQFCAVQGRTLLRTAFDVLIEGGCDPVVVVVPLLHLDEAAALLPPGTHIVAGGPTRQASVAAGIAVISADHVVVHDAARPFATSELVKRVTAALTQADAVVPVVPIEDTVKRVRADVIVETLDRSELWRSQTPQGFRSEALRDAHRQAEAESFSATDDAQLVERYGGRVVVVPGEETNLKITSAADLERLMLGGVG